MSDHSGHPATSGNSAHTNAANPEGTSLSPSSASFMAANGSPFTSIDDMIPQGVRVVDPETTERTCTTTIQARLNIPVVSNMTGTEGKLLLIMDADPLSQMPLWVSRNMYETPISAYATGAGGNLWNEDGVSDNGKTTLTDPMSWGQTWEMIGLDDFYAQTYELGQMSLKHRIVGAGIRANVGVDTTLGRGSIEGGQFNWNDTRYVEPTYRAVPTAASDSKAQAYWMPLLDPEVGATVNNVWVPFTSVQKPIIEDFRRTNKGLGTLLTTNAYTLGERVIRSARTQDYGTLDADKGISVRWTDSNDFKFQKTYNRNIVVPDSGTYSNGVMTSIGVTAGTNEAVQDNEFTTQVDDEICALNCAAYRTNNTQYFNAVNYNVYKAGAVKSKLATKRCSFLSDGSWKGTMQICGDTNSVIDLAQGTGEYTVGTNTYKVGNVPASVLGTDTFESHFDKGLYLNITGVSPAQWVSVDIVYHIEYMPKSWALTRGIHPPVDLQFDMLASMLSDPKQFPIVVQGNSFFTSLWRGIKKAADTAARVAGAAGSIISSAGGDIDPRLRLVGNALRDGAALYKRARHI